MKRFSAMELFFIFALLAAVAMTTACTTTGTTTETDKSVAPAKIIARKAGKYVALNNPAVAVSVTTGYAAIEALEGDDFRGAFLDGLESYLESEGIAGSAELRADAEDILDIFGFDLAATSIDLPFLQNFEVGNIKTIVNAFIEGMAFAGAS